jgi:transposase
LAALAPAGRLLFFDVKPVAVKAYGGRRYTSVQKLVLPRARKLARFYLFVAYDAVDGRVYWAFYPGKSARYVCQFMRRLRRCFPDQSLWVALDQDRAHPCKSRDARRVMRALGLHWISLPKASPDDNPVEVVFSDIQLMVLDNSNDPDARATQRRISRHLRSRNRRKDRPIHIPYLY